jgi:hypothetical protein
MKCPQCESELIFDGHVSSENWAFKPRDMRFFAFYEIPKLVDGSVFHACAKCGLVWSRINAFELVELIRTKGKPEAAARLPEDTRY